jgi:hypothetical protein
LLAVEPNLLLNVILALFGVVALSVAFQSIRTGQTAFRGEAYGCHEQPFGFWISVVTYAILGAASLAGAAWNYYLGQ